MEVELNRRGLLAGLGATLFVATAPAIVRPGLIMPIKPRLVPTQITKRLWQVVSANWGLDAARMPYREYGNLRLMEVLTTSEVVGFKIHSQDVVALDESRVFHKKINIPPQQVFSWYSYEGRPMTLSMSVPRSAEVIVDALYAANMSSWGQLVEMD